MKISKLVLATLVSTSLLGALAPVQAADEINVVPGLSIVGAPLALHGYDPVAYFTDGRPQRGSDTLAYIHEGAAYRFSSQEHLDRFKQDLDGNIQKADQNWPEIEHTAALDL